MKKCIFLLFAATISFVLVACSDSVSPETESIETPVSTESTSFIPEAIEVQDVEVLDFSVSINDIEVTHDTMSEYPIYSVRSATSTNTSETYVGYSFSDVFEAAGFTGSYSAFSVTLGDGSSIELSPGLASMSTTLLAVTKDGEPTVNGPWFAPCESGVMDHYLSNVVSITMEGALPPLPPATPDPASQFGVDININNDTIDNWLGRSDVVYRDLRMLFDPADYAAIGGDPDLTRSIRGFRIIPYPYVATMPELPVEGAYTGETLFNITWYEDGRIAYVEANYAESIMVVEELFPKDRAIFMICGGGGYASAMKDLLIYLGWDESKLYNIGANWTYDGERPLDLIMESEENPEFGLLYTTWRANYTFFEFDRLHPTDPTLVFPKSFKPAYVVAPPCDC